MNKKLKSIIVIICTLGLVVLYGCAGMANLATPCHIDERVIAYSEEDPTSYLPWTTLWDAGRITSEVNFQHDLKQIEIERELQDDNSFYAHITEVQIRHTASAQEIKEAVFTPTGPVGLGLTTLFGGTMGALLIPRPGDRKKKV